jgi:predicted ester cyclase
MPLDPKSLIHRWFDEVWNRGQEETVDELLSIDGIGYGLGESNSEVRGPAGFKIFLRNMRAALPDVHIHIEDTIVQGDKAVVRVLLEGTHLGEGLGLSPTGRRVTVSGIVIVRVVGSQIIEGWNSWDQLGLLQQIGAIPAPQTVDRFLAIGA